MSYTVEFSPEARDQLEGLERYIAEVGSPVNAARYVDAIVTYCYSLGIFPHRGTRRDYLRPGLRTTNYKGRAVIVFAVDADTETVSIVGVFYGGQDYEAAFDLDDDEPRSI